MTLDIVKGADHKILRTVSKPVKEINKKTLKFLREMDKAMEKAKGVGIAAPQVGENVRIFLALLNNKKIIAMINPEITSHSEEMEYGEEGCLSLPGKWGPVPRHKELTVRYLDEKSHQRTLKLKDFNARVIQHEMDHLNAMLFIDRVESKSDVSNVINKG